MPRAGALFAFTVGVIAACASASAIWTRNAGSGRGAKVSAVWYAGASARRPLIAGNWKLNPATAPEALALLKLVVANQRALESSGRTAELPDVAIFPPFPFLQLAVDAVAGTGIKVGAQNVGLEGKGAFTGEVSASMVRSLGCQLVLLGHSERRLLYGEDDEMIRRKVRLALDGGLDVVLCVGETEAEYEMGLLPAVCALQLKKALHGLQPADLERISIAYEPVWAIGTGRTATPAQAQDAHAIIRSVIAELFEHEPARAVRIAYGGSVTPESIDDLMRMPDVDGALVGGASLIADKFSRIVEFAPPDRPRSAPRQLSAREVVACKNALGESPVWSAAQHRLFWASAADREVWSWNLRDAPLVRKFDQIVGSVALVDDGRLLVNLEDRTLAYSMESGVAAELERAPEPHGLTRLNDARVDRAGQLVVGAYNNFHRAGVTAGDDNAGLYRLGASGLEEILDYRFRVSNAIAFSPDGRTMYFCDSPTRKVFSFAYDPYARGAASLTGRRLVYTMPSALAGSPDGAQVDASGGLWLALSGAGQVVRIDPATGETRIVVHLPVASPTSVTFGGAELDTLFVTTRGPDGGGLFSVQVPFGLRGLAEPTVPAALVERLLESCAAAAVAA